MSRRLIRLLGLFAAVVLMLMMLLTFVDVIGRYVFDFPIPGSFELTEMMMATLIFAGLPVVTAQEEHVTIDLLDALVPHWLRAPRDGIISLVCAVLMGFLGWRMAIKAGETVAYNDITAVLNIPMWPMTYFMTIMTFLTTIVLVVLALLRLAPRLLPRN